VTNAVARRYAKAFYGLAAEDKAATMTVDDMSKLASALDTIPEMKRIFFNPALKSQDQKKIISSVTSNKWVHKFVELLSSRKRLNLLTQVANEMSKLDDSANGIRRVLVCTATALDDQQKKEIETQVAQRLGGRVISEFQISPELIGGVWMKMGDNVWDVSLKGKLEQVRSVLINND
jgi:F-type H+-transporting ATPase subunit delta